MGLKQNVARAIFRGWGWSIEGPLPYDVPKCVVPTYPHTSNWDFPVGVLFRPAFGVQIDFVAKHTLFKGPLGGVMRWLGGKPVVRVGNTKFVDAVAEIFHRNDVFRLCITPEGTRAKPEVLKSGYHHIARAAGVPIVFCAFHWDRKVMRWSAPYHPTDDYAATSRAFDDFFRGTVGYHPGDAYEIPAPASHL